MKTKKVQSNLHRKSPLFIMVFTFFGIILAGALLFMLPISTNDGYALNFIDALFLSTSAVCVTGLSPVSNVGLTLAPFGRVILAILIEFGGLGFVTIVISIITLFGFKVGISQRALIKEALNQNSLSGLVSLVRKIMFTAFAIQSIGFILNLFVFIPKYPFWEAVGYSIFHAISSFNNAGFDLFGDSSLIQFSGDILLNISTCLMIILGGIGFIVIFDVVEHKKFNKLSLHSKIALKTTAILIIAGSLFFKFTNWDSISWMEAIFLSVTARTAGFTSIDLNILSSSSMVILILLMFVGASPSSTGGGIKTTTLYTMIKSIYSFIIGSKTTKSYNRKISDEQVLKAFVLTVFSSGFVLFMTILLMIFEGNAFTFKELIFEGFSAFGTVGLSMSVTPQLSWASKIVVCIMMFVGRLGPITFMSILNQKTFAGSADDVRYIEEKIIIG